MKFDLEEALLALDPDAIVRAVCPPPNLAEPPAQETVEGLLRAALVSPDPVQRRNAGLAAYALTHVDRGAAVARAVSGDILERLIAAAMVESDQKVLVELLTALASQDFSGELAVYGSLVARVVESFVATTAPVSAEVLSRLAYAYEKLRRQTSVALLDELKIVEREPVGFAATGLLFTLADIDNAKVILVHNRKLGAWLPPGGHFDPRGGEVPTRRLLSKIRRETGVRAGLLWNAASFPINSVVNIEPSPSFVLFEDLRSIRTSPMEAHAFHYDFNYICTVDKGEEAQLGRGTHTCVTVDLAGAPLSRKRLRDEVHRRIEQATSALEADALSSARILPDVVERIVLSLMILRDYHNSENRAQEQLWRLSNDEAAELPSGSTRQSAAQLLHAKPTAVRREGKAR